MKALELATLLESDTADELLCQAYCDHMIDAAAELRRLAAAESGCAPYLKEGETPAERIKRALGDADSLMNLYRDVVAERDALKAELETERMRLAACGVVAMSNTKESAEINRKMAPEYWSASCADVASMVDREMALRAELERIKALPPVAWRTFDGEGGYDYRTYDMNESYAEDYAKRNPNHAHWVEPLYALGSKTDE